MTGMHEWKHCVVVDFGIVYIKRISISKPALATMARDQGRYRDYYYESAHDTREEAEEAAETLRIKMELSR